MGRIKRAEGGIYICPWHVSNTHHAAEISLGSICIAKHRATAFVFYRESLKSQSSKAA